MSDATRDAWTARVRELYAKQGKAAPATEPEPEPAPEPRARTEDQLLRAVIELALRCGWLAHHVHDSRHEEWGTSPGFPDLVLVRGAEVLVAELKSNSGRVSKEQQRWLASFMARGIEAYVWRPRDWDQIERRLTRRQAA